jgi:hypothetical protein
LKFREAGMIEQRQGSVEPGDGDDGEVCHAGACPMGDGSVRQINGDDYAAGGQVDSTANYVVPAPFGEPAVGKSAEDALGGDQPRVNDGRAVWGATPNDRNDLGGDLRHELRLWR